MKRTPRQGLRQRLNKKVNGKIEDIFVEWNICMETKKFKIAFTAPVSIPPAMI